MNFTLINDGELKEKNLKVIFLVVASAVISIAGFLENSLLYSISNIGFFVFGLFIDPLIPLCISIATSAMSLQTSAIIAIGLKSIMTFSAVCVYLIRDRRAIGSKEFLFLFTAGFLLVLSFLLGTETQLVTAILQMMTLMCYLAASNVYTKNRNVLVVCAFVLAGVYMSIAVLFQIAFGSAVSLWGTRLTYNGSVRTLATALAFPIFIFLAKILLPREKRMGVGKMCLMIASLVIMSGLLIATYSRGVLIAVIVAAAYLVLAQFRRLSSRQVILYIVIFVVVSYFLLNVEFDTEFMFSGISDGSGRIDIWAFFFEKMGENGLIGYLFGFGPGDILRISDGTLFEGYYSHSVLLDYLFSYGFMGFCLLMYMIFRTLSAAVKSKNVMYVGLLILTIVTYATHGNSASLEFHILLGLIYSLSLSQIEKNKELNQKKAEVPDLVGAGA